MDQACASMGSEGGDIYFGDFTVVCPLTSPLFEEVTELLFFHLAEDKTCVVQACT